MGQRLKLQFWASSLSGIGHILMKARLITFLFIPLWMWSASANPDEARWGQLNQKGESAYQRADYAYAEKQLDAALKEARE